MSRWTQALREGLLVGTAGSLLSTLALAAMAPPSPRHRAAPLQPPGYRNLDITS